MSFVTSSSFRAKSRDKTSATLFFALAREPLGVVDNVVCDAEVGELSGQRQVHVAIVVDR
jgi:hypothetical protein